ncbi:Uncharacterised protein [uncultured archaeon]|nr:Uncharacterised protein [uncultured archaeon]
MVEEETEESEEDKNKYTYDDSILPSFESTRKKLLKSVQDKLSKSSSRDINFHEDPIGDAFESAVGIHFGMTEEEKKKMKKEIEKELESEKDYLEVL